MPNVKHARPQSGGQKSRGSYSRGASNSSSRSNGGGYNRGNNRSSNPGAGDNSSNSFSRRPRHKSRSGGKSGGKRTGAYIHPSKFINRANPDAQEVAYEATHKFADFPFGPKLHKNIQHKGYEVPSAIQDQSIMPLLEGHDVIGLANTGTGKTAAFLLPIIEKLSVHQRPNTVLILAPTRELAQQIEEQFRDFSYGMRLYSVLLVGGTNMGQQIARLHRGPHIIIGTP
ncbi:hypothetical protein B7Z17_03360, partial [Candidatus Saccharibacteria bacterium 32-49-10]